MDIYQQGSVETLQTLVPSLIDVVGGVCALFSPFVALSCFEKVPGQQITENVVFDENIPCTLRPQLSYSDSSLRRVRH